MKVNEIVTETKNQDKTNISKKQFWEISNVEPQGNYITNVKNFEIEKSNELNRLIVDTSHDCILIID